jgi:PAS domain S-box-containing protein
MTCSTLLRLACTALIVWVAGALPAFSQARQIVLLYDERTDLPGLAMLDAGFSRGLSSESQFRFEIYREAMDLSRFDSYAYRNLLRDHLRAKYAAKKIDVIVAVLEPALDFLLSHRDEVFPGVPIVFCGIDRRRFGDRPLPSDVTGVLLKREFSPTLELALSLHPETDRVVVVAGASEFDSRLLQQAREEFRPFENRLTFTYLTALPLPELLSQLSQLSPKTVVLFSTMFRDGAGESFVPHEVAERISAAANAPVYGFVDQYLGRGIVGGRLYGLGAHGESAAALVVKILAGAKPSELPLIEPANSITAFDWQQLRRWGIDESRLPPGSDVRFHELSLWEKYRWEALGVVAVVATQAALISILLVQHGRRRRAQIEAQQKLDRTRRQAAALVALLRSKTVTAGNVQEAFGEITETAVRVLKVTRAAVWLFDETESELRCLVGFDGVGVTHRSGEVMQARDYPRYLEALRNGRAIDAADALSDPRSSEFAASYLKPRGISSILDASVRLSGRLAGVVHHEHVGAPRVWHDDEVSFAGALADQIAQVLLNAEREKTAGDLRESQERLNLATASAKIGAWRWGVQDGKFEATPECRVIFGWQPDERLDFTKFIQRVHPEDRVPVQQALHKAVSEGSTYDAEYRITPDEDQIYWVAARGKCHYADRAPADMTGVVMDITGRKDAEERLRESEARFRTVADSAPVLIWMSGKDRLCTFFNTTWLEFTGRELELELGNGWTEGVHPDDLAGCLKTYSESFDARRPFTMEYRLRGRDGEYHWISDNGVPRYDADGDFLGYIGSCADITERKQIEAEVLYQRAELAHVARVSTMGELAASVAHELNQPLGAILANAEAAELFLQQHPPALEDLRAILADIRKDDERAGEVIRRMRALLRKHELERQPLEMNSLVEDVLQLVSGDAALRGVSLSADLGPGLPKVTGDRVHLQQVLLNLILNGMDAMAGQPRERRRLIVRTRLAMDGMTELVVTDSGHGIDPDKLPRVFEPFYTTKPSGMGMGLSIARTIIEAHHGRIWAENNESGGAVFRVTLPVVIG